MFVHKNKPNSSSVSKMYNPFSTLEGYTCNEAWPANEFSLPEAMDESQNSTILTENYFPNKKRNRQSSTQENKIRELSTEEIIKVASAYFIQTSSLITGDPSQLKLPFNLTLSTIPKNNLSSVELVTLLLTVAEKVSNEQYTRANVLLEQCKSLSSKHGTAVQRLVFYFTEALQEMIDSKNGKFVAKRKEEMEATTKLLLLNHPVYLVVNDKLPFSQVMHFTAIQAHLDNVACSKKIHMIDLSIRFGNHWIMFLQGLAGRNSCNIESIKISVVGESEEFILEIGKRITDFAKSLNLHVTFLPVLITDFKELRETMFTMNEDERVGVYSSLNMNCLITKPESLNNLMVVLRNLKPKLVTVLEVEANNNSPLFINRFTDALFFNSTCFDSFESLMKADVEERLWVEELLSQGLKSVIASDESERVVRQVGIGVWRAFFRRFGLREVDVINKWSMYQARLIIKQFVEDDNACTLEMNGKALLIGWKGTPLHYISGWNFSQDEEITTI